MNKWKLPWSRGNQILAGLLVIQIAIAVVVFWPRSAAQAGGQALFPDLDVEAVSRISVRDDAGQEIVLAQETGNWVLPNAGSYPCRAESVPDFMAKVAALKGDRIVTETSASHKQLRVASDDYVRLVEFETGDGMVQRFYLGSSPSYSVIHARLEGEDEVYLVSGLSTADASTMASGWVDTSYLSVDQTEIAALILENANGTLSLAKSGETWTLEGLAEDETLNETAVTSLVSRSASVRLVAPLGTELLPEYGIDTPSAVVVMHTSGDEGKTITLHVGAQIGDDGAYVVKSSESPYYVRVAEYSAGDWVEKTREDLLEAPPTPAP